MKRIIALLLATAMCLSFAACGGSDDKDSGAGKTTDDNNSAAIQVDEGLFNVEITMASTFFDDLSEDEIKKAAEEKGYSKCIVNADGSVTYTMSKSKHEEVLKELKAGLDETVAGMLEGENAVASFVSIDYTDDFSQVDIYVNDQYSFWDSLYVLTFYVSGAYYQSFAGVNADDIDVIVNFIDNDTKETLDTGSYKSFMSNADSNNSGAEEDTSGDVTVKAGTPLAVGETVTIADECEIYLEYTDITDNVMPPSPGRWYHYYEADDGKIYIDICVAYKNLGAKTKDADNILNATLIYAGKYQYRGFSIIEEDNRSDFAYSSLTSIDPLDLVYLHYLFEVPEIVGTSDNSLMVNLNVGGNQYDIVVREGADGEGDTLNSNAVAKTSGNIKQGEVIAVMNNCEFQIDYCNITDDVMPKSPSEYYHHYEADDGKVYVDFCIAYKNWKSKSVMADEVISGTLTYGGKYEYKGASMIEEDNRGDFTYSSTTSIAPLTTEYLHLLFEVPTEVETGSETIEIAFTVGGNTYSYKVR